MYSLQVSVKMSEISYLKILVFCTVLLMLFDLRSSKFIENITEDTSTPLTEIITTELANLTKEYSSDTSTTSTITPKSETRHISSPFADIMRVHGSKPIPQPTENSSNTVVRACNSNSQCMKDECCLQKPWTNHFFCAKRIREGKVCWSKPHNATDTWDKYRVICPCVSKHECVFKEPIFVLKPVLAASTCQPKPDDADKM